MRGSEDGDPVLLRGRLHLVALGALLLAACGPRPAWVDTDQDAAPVRALYDLRELLREGRPAEAIQLAEGLVAQHPGSWRAHRALQDAHRATLPPSAFMRRYAGPEPGGEDALAWYLRGRATIQDVDAAHAAFTRAAELAPERPWSHVGLAYLHYVRGDLFSAVELYEDRLRRFPRSRALRLAAANQYIELRLLVQAQRQLDVALRLAPEDPEVQSAMGKTQLGLNNTEGALRWLESSLAAEPRQGDAYPMLAELYLRLQRPAEAEDAYRAGLDLGQPEDVELATAIRIALLTEPTR